MDCKMQESEQGTEQTQEPDLEVAQGGRDYSTLHEYQGTSDQEGRNQGISNWSQDLPQSGLNLKAAGSF